MRSILAGRRRVGSRGPLADLFLRPSMEREAEGNSPEAFESLHMTRTCIEYPGHHWFPTGDEPQSPCVCGAYTMEDLGGEDSLLHPTNYPSEWQGTYKEKLTRVFFESCD